MQMVQIGLHLSSRTSVLSKVTYGEPYRGNKENWVQGSLNITTNV